MSAKNTVQWMVLGAVVSLGVACDGVQPERRDVRYFAPFQTSVPKPQQFEDRGPQLSDAEKNVYEPIVDGFQKNHTELLRRPDVTTQLERIENVYIEAGRYLDLYAIYQKDYAQFGVQSPTAERLAWGSIRLGQQNYARAVIDDLLQNKPTATAYFVEGAYWLQWDPSSSEAQAKSVAAWKKTLELDPRYRGFESITAGMIAEQVGRMEAALAKNPPPAPAKDPIEAAREVVDQAPDIAVAAANPAPAPEVAPEAPVEEVKPEQPPVAQAPTPVQDVDTQYRIAIARAEMLASEGKQKQSEDLFLMAKALKPDGFEAEFGQLRVGWGSEDARPEVSRRMRLLSERKGLTARQYYEIGIFAFTKMQDKPMTSKMFDQVKALDPALATQLNVDGILSRKSP